MGIPKYLRTLLCTFTTLYIAIGKCNGEVQIDTTDVADGTVLQISEGINVLLQCRVMEFTSNHIISWSFNDNMITYNDTVIDDRLINRGSDFVFYSDSDITTSVGYSYINWKAVTKFDTGTYSCGVYEVDSPEAGDVLVARKTFIIDVSYVPSDDYPKCTPDGEIFVEIGQPLGLSCLSEEGYPRVNLSWERHLDGGSPHLVGITSEGNGFVKSELNYVAVDLSVQNALFVCTMNSSLIFQQLQRSCSVRIHVVLPEPLVSISPQIGVITVGDSITFTYSSLLTANHVRWSTEPAIPAARTDSILSTHMFTISNVEASDNGTMIICTVLFKSDWIRATATLLVVNEESFFQTTAAIPSTSLQQTNAVVRSSSVGWMIACIAVSTVAVIGFVACFFVYRRKSQSSKPTMKVLDRNGQTVTVPTTPNYSSRINGVVSAEQTMGPGEYMTYHRPEPDVIADESQQRKKHRPLQRVAPGIHNPENRSSSDIKISVGDRHRPTSDMDNPAYMTTGIFVGVGDKPVKIRNLSNISRDSTEEPGYMALQL